MTTFQRVAEAWIVSRREHCAGSWAAFNSGSISSVTCPSLTFREDDVDRALEALVARGKVKPGRNGRL